MLDENGNLHVKATLDRDANVLIFNGSEYWPEEGSRQVEFDIPIHAGLNLTYVKTLSSMFAVNDFGTQYKLYLYCRIRSPRPCALTTRASPTAR